MYLASFGYNVPAQSHMTDAGRGSAFTTQINKKAALLNDNLSY